MKINLNLPSRLNQIGCAVAVAIFLLACGALLAFVLAPQQALQARRVERLPVMAAEDVDAAAPGDDVLITGRLEDNPVIAEDGFVAYVREVWVVERPTPTGQTSARRSEPVGKWEVIERDVPDLTVNVDGRLVQIQRTNGVAMSGALHERLIYARTFYAEEAWYQGVKLKEGSERLRGLYNGDRITVLGTRASTGGVVPEELFAGDRETLIQRKKSSVRSLLVFGFCLMGLAPVALVVGILTTLFGRRSRVRVHV